MKELIEKLENARDYTKGRTQSINVALKFEELEDLLQALTSVKSESEMSYENQKAIQDNLVESYPFKKSESAEDYKQPLQEFTNSRPYYGSCTTEYKEGIEDGAKWMHDFANNSEGIKENAIGFKQYIDSIEMFSLRTLSDEERYKEYLVYLTNKEK